MELGIFKNLFLSEVEITRLAPHQVELLPNELEAQLYEQRGACLQPFCLMSFWIVFSQVLSPFTRVKKTLRFRGKNLEDFEQHLANSGRSYRNIPITLKREHIRFHNGSTFHGSP